MKIKVDGHEIDVLQHAVVKTDTGVAGYFECVVGGKNVRCVGRYDNPYSEATTETHGNEVDECIWVDDVWQELVPGEEPYMIVIENDDGISCESIMNQIASDGDAILQAMADSQRVTQQAWESAVKCAEQNISLQVDSHGRILCKCPACGREYTKPEDGVKR